MFASTMRLAVVATITALSAVASAAPPGEAPHGEPPPTETRVLGGKSENVATALTIAGIAAPFALGALTYEPNTDFPIYAPIVAIGSLFGPALGHLYSNRIGTYGIAMRLGALTVGMVGWQYVDDANKCARGEEPADGCIDGSRPVGKVLIGVGLAAWAGSWVYDLYSARREVRRYNERRTVQVFPTASSTGAGFALGGTF